MLQKMANVPCGAVTPYSGFQRHPKSRRSGAVSTSQSPKSKQFSFARFCYACGTPNLFMPAIWSPTLLASCCASQADYTHCDGLPRNGSHVAGLCLSVFQILRVAVVMLEVATASLACSGFQYMCRSLTWHASSAPVAPGMGIRGCRPGNCKRPCRSPDGPSSRILRLKLLFPMNHTNLFAWRSCKLQDSISQTCQASTSSLACIPRTQCHHLLLSPSEFSCEVTLKKTLTFQGTSDFLRPGSGFLVTSLESSR